MGHSLLKHVIREVVHDAQQRTLSDADHVTKHSGGTPTHGAANHKTHTTPAGKSEMADVTKAATGTCGPHGYND